MSITGYKEAQEALANAQEHLEGYRYGRAIKEADRGLQAGYFIDELKKLRQNAAERRDRLDALRPRIDKLVEKERYEDAGGEIAEALELNPNDEELRALRRDLPERINQRDVAKLRSQIEHLRNTAKNAAVKGEVEASLTAWQELLAIAPNDTEAKQNVARVEEEVRKRRLRGVRNVAIAAVVMTLCYAVWSGWANQLASFTKWVGIPTTADARRILWAQRSIMLGGCMTCMATYGNGVMIGMGIIRQAWLRIRPAREQGCPVFTAAALGSTSPGSAVLRTATGVFQATRAAATVFVVPGLLNDHLHFALLPFTWDVGACPLPSQGNQPQYAA